METSSKSEITPDAPARSGFFTTENVLQWIASPWGSGILAFVVYLLLACLGKTPFTSSIYAYYNYLADAFLHGQIALRLTPPTTHDLVIYQGQIYLYWPPFPSFLLMPFIAIFGVQFSDALFTVMLGALNTGLIALLLSEAERAHLLDLSTRARAILVLFFAFGTVHMTLAPIGWVWGTGQLVGFACVTLGYWAAIHFKGWKAFFWTGLAFACAFLTRNTLVFAAVWPAFYLFQHYSKSTWRQWCGYLVAAAGPLVSALAIYGIYNAARFGSPIDIGYAYHNMGANFRTDFKVYGAFNIHYLPINFFYQYINYPYPLRPDSLMGGSLFLLSPLFFYAFRAVWKGRRNLSVWSLVLSITAVNVPILLLMGTGAIQFGPRYTLDFTTPLLLLTAMGLQKNQERIPALLAMISFISYLGGVMVFLAIL